MNTDKRGWKKRAIGVNLRLSAAQIMFFSDRYTA
jgi:hypothetical protein